MNLFDVISPLMKDDGKVIGHFFDCSKAPKSLKNIKLVHPDFEPESLSLSRTYTNISNAGLKIIEKRRKNVLTKPRFGVILAERLRKGRSGGGKSGKNFS